MELTEPNIPFVTEHRNIYRCPWCGKPYLRKQDVIYHINIKCHKNPEHVHPCFWCDHLEKKTTEITRFDVNQFGCEVERRCPIESFHCKKHDDWMYSRLACKHEHPCSKDGDHLPMPHECDDFSREGVQRKWNLEEFNGKPWYKKHNGEDITKSKR